MRRLVFATGVAVAPMQALAEGKNDPIIGCVFENGRQIILAEDGDGFEWREDDFTGAAHCIFGTTVMCIADHDHWGAQALTLAGGQTPQELRFGIPTGTAVLSGVVFAPGALGLASEPGLCERIGR